jgi:hypothetical protein
MIHAEVMTVSWGFYPIATDAASSGYALGLAAMRLIAGPVRNDRFAANPDPSESRRKTLSRFRVNLR